MLADEFNDSSSGVDWNSNASSTPPASLPLSSVLNGGGISFLEAAERDDLCRFAKELVIAANNTNTTQEEKRTGQQDDSSSGFNESFQFDIEDGVGLC